MSSRVQQVEGAPFIVSITYQGGRHYDVLWVDANDHENTTDVEAIWNRFYHQYGIDCADLPESLHDELLARIDSDHAKHRI